MIKQKKHAIWVFKYYLNRYCFKIRQKALEFNIKMVSYFNRCWKQKLRKLETISGIEFDNNKVSEQLENKKTVGPYLIKKWITKKSWWRGKQYLLFCITRYKTVISWKLPQWLNKIRGQPREFKQNDCHRMCWYSR